MSRNVYSAVEEVCLNETISAIYCSPLYDFDQTHSTPRMGFVTLEGSFFLRDPFKWTSSSWADEPVFSSANGNSLVSCTLGRSSRTFLLGDSKGNLIESTLTESGYVSKIHNLLPMDAAITQISCSIGNRDLCAITSSRSAVFLYDSRNMQHVNKLTGKIPNKAVGCGENCVITASTSSAVCIFDLRYTKCALFKFNAEDMVTCISEPPFDRTGCNGSNMTAFGTAGGRCFTFRTIPGHESENFNQYSNKCFIPYDSDIRSDLTCVSVLPNNQILCGDSVGNFRILSAGSCKYILSDSLQRSLSTDQGEVITMGGTCDATGGHTFSSFSRAKRSIIRFYSNTNPTCISN